MLFPAAFRFVLIGFLFVQSFFLPATAGVVCASFWRTSTDRAVGDTFSRNGMSDHRRAQGHRSQRTQDNHGIQNDKHDCRYEAWESPHTNYSVAPFIEHFKITGTVTVTAAIASLSPGRQGSHSLTRAFHNLQPLSLSYMSLPSSRLRRSLRMPICQFEPVIKLQLGSQYLRISWHKHFLG